MNTFQNENRIIFNFQFITFIFLLPQREVKARKLHFLTAQQSLQLLVKQFQIERIQRLIIIVTVFIQRCLFTVYEIIVQGDREGFEPVRHQLDGKTFAESGLTRRGRTGNQNQFHPVTVFPTMEDRIGNLGYFLFLQRFRYID